MNLDPSQTLTLDSRRGKTDHTVATVHFQRRLSFAAPRQSRNPFSLKVEQHKNQRLKQYSRKTYWNFKLDDIFKKRQ